ncbi:MAG TPA: hypothetical protein VJ798_06205 [Rhizomicrobium sp.]|nr:hypothetical protein [Rhizomicrobium sp.]
MPRTSRIVVLVALLSGGCNMPTLVDGSRPATIGNLTVSPQANWNQISLNTGHTVWTQNGLTLDSLHFLTNVQDGKPLYPISGIRTADQLPYRGTMLPNDVQDLVVSTLQREGYDNVRAGSLAPCPFLGATGFCFELDFATKEGLVMKGKVTAQKRDTALDVVQFRAPAEYYFPSLAPTVDKIVASAQPR